MLASIFTILLVITGIWDGVLQTVIYSLIGIAMAILGFKVVDWITPGKMTEKIAKEGNVAMAILVGSLILGICIIIGQVIGG
jgi:putative membrane protein